jgi:hypothetical protein
MAFLSSLVVSFFLSLKWVTNKKLLVHHNVSWDEIVVLRYLVALFFSVIICFFTSTEINLQINFLPIIFLVCFSDFIWTYLHQKYMKMHPNSSFQNFLWSFVPVVYIPIGVLFLGEQFWLYDAIWVGLICLSLLHFTKFKELDFLSITLWFLIISRIGSIFSIWYYISQGWYFLHLLIFVYIFVIFTYLFKYLFNKFPINKISKTHLLDAFIFSIGSIWSFYLYQILESYEARLFLLSTIFFNIILYKIFFNEKNFITKILLAFPIVIWLIFLKI